MQGGDGMQKRLVLVPEWVSDDEIKERIIARSVEWRLRQLILKHSNLTGVQGPPINNANY